MTETKLTPIEIGLTAAIVAVETDEPAILVAADGAKGDARAGLPFGPFDPVAHRTFEIGLRAWVEAQTGLRVGYVEQLYTFGDRGRHVGPRDTAPHVVSIGYLALSRMSDNAATLRGSAAGFEPWYRFFPWEDWREGRPAILDTTILPLLEEWAGRVQQPEPGRALGRRDRVRLCFAVDGSPWDEEKVLDRYELLYEAGLVEEARSRRPRSRACPRSFPRARRSHPVRSSAHSRHRHRAAAGEAEIPPRGVRVDAGGIHADGIAAHGRGDLRPASAQAEFPTVGGNRGAGGADRRNVDRDRRATSGALSFPP
jgi:hypothetical protein